MTHEAVRKGKRVPPGLASRFAAEYKKCTGDAYSAMLRLSNLSAFPSRIW